MSTPNLAIVHIAASQNQKEVTANSAFDDLDLALTNPVSTALTGLTYTVPTATALYNMVFRFTGSLSGTCVITLPANKKLYIVSNQTNHPLQFESPTPGRTALVNDSLVGSAPTPAYTILYCDGVNVDSISTLQGLSDVEVGSQTDGQFLAWSAALSAWTNITGPQQTGGVSTKSADYSVLASDSGSLIQLTSGSHTFTLPNPVPNSKVWFLFKNIGTGVLTISRNSLTIDGKSSNLTLHQGDAIAVFGDGTNYETGTERTVSIGVYMKGTGANNDVLLYLKMDRAVVFPASAPNAFAVASVAATGSTTYTLKKNGSSFATIVFSASGTTGAFTQASDATFAAGDVLEIDGPATADTTLANMGITLQGYRF